MILFSADKLSNKESINRGRTTDKKPTRSDDLPKFLGMPLYGLKRHNSHVEHEKASQPSAPITDIHGAGELTLHFFS